MKIKKTVKTTLTNIFLNLKTFLIFKLAVKHRSITLLCHEIRAAVAMSPKSRDLCK